MNQVDRNLVAITVIICLTAVAIASLVTNHDSTIVIALVGLIGTIVGYVFGVIPKAIATKKNGE